MSHLQNCSLKIYLKRALGGRVGGVRMDVIFFFFWGGGSGRVGGGVGLGVRVDVNSEVKFL